MNKKLLVISLFVATTCLAQQPVKQEKSAPASQPAVAVWEQRSPLNEPLSGVNGSIIKVSAKIAKIDHQSRLVTLVGADGSLTTLKASENVKRFHEIKVGDEVVVQYVEALAFEVRPPTEEEIANPAAVVVEAGRADKNSPPAAGAAQVVHQIVKVSAIDKKAMTVTIELADGSKETIKAKYPENLDRVKVGDTVAVTYSQMVALSLDPAPSPKK